MLCMLLTPRQRDTYQYLANVAWNPTVQMSSCAGEQQRAEAVRDGVIEETGRDMQISRSVGPYVREKKRWGKSQAEARK